MTRKALLLCHTELLSGCAHAHCYLPAGLFSQNAATQVSHGEDKGKNLKEMVFFPHTQKLQRPLFDHTCEGGEGIPPFENLLTLLLSVVKCLREDLDKTPVSGT